MSTRTGDCSKPVFDVVIIGGGASGLTAAYQILKHQPETKLNVLEAKERLGGRICEARLKAIHGEDSWDVGGQWVARSQPHVIELLDELGLETYEQDLIGKKVSILGDKKSKSFSAGKYSTYGLSLFSALDVLRHIKKMDYLTTLVPLDCPSNCPYAEEWDRMTVEEVQLQTFWSSATKQLMDVGIHVMFGAEPSQISFLYFLYFVKKCGGYSAVVDPEKKGYAQEWKVKGGAFSIINRLAQNIGYDNIRCGAPVIAVEQKESSVNITLLSGEVVSAGSVIIAIPPCLRGKILFTPQLPYDHGHLLERMPIAHLTKFIATYPRKFWKEKGYSGEAYHWPLYSGGQAAPVCLVFDASLTNGSPALVGFVGGKRAADFNKLEAEEQKKAIIGSLVLFFGRDAAEPVDVFIKDWANEPWNGGCPVSIMAPGVLSMYRQESLKEPFQRIHWAGTETAMFWSGYIDGAVESGLRAANEVILKLNPEYTPPPTKTFKDITLQTDNDLLEENSKWLGLGAVCFLCLSGAAAIFAIKSLYKP